MAAGDKAYWSDIAKVASSYYVKSTATSRLSTVTLADDPELTGIALAVGTYEIELLLFYTVASTTPKLKTRWGFTGTWNSPIRGCIGPGDVNVAGPQAVTETTVRGYGADNQDAIYNSSTSSAYSHVRETTYAAVVTTAGNLSLQWAQQTSTASNVTVQAQTGFRIRRVA